MYVLGDDDEVMSDNSFCISIKSLSYEILIFRTIIPPSRGDPEGTNSLFSSETPRSLSTVTPDIDLRRSFALVCCLVTLSTICLFCRESLLTFGKNNNLFSRRGLNTYYVRIFPPWKRTGGSFDEES